MARSAANILISFSSGALNEIRHILKAQLDGTQQHLEVTQAQTRQNQTQYKSDKTHRYHQTFKTSPYE
jgi:hypothetical protein